MIVMAGLKRELYLNKQLYIGGAFVTPSEKFPPDMTAMTIHPLARYRLEQAKDSVSHVCLIRDINPFKKG